MTGGVIDCWGDNSVGAAGVGDAVQPIGGIVQNPTPVAGLGGVSVSAAGCGHFHTCALLSNGTIRCWGQDDGAFGLGTINAMGEFLNQAAGPVTGITTAVQIVAGTGFNCALLSSGNVECWGTNDVGQLGRGTTSVNPQATAAPVQW
jgi:alpha-tubulin suppressor-like RCC1 family protein